MGAVRRVDVDEDHADVGGGVLQQGPLGVVRTPQSHSIANLQAEPEEAGAEPFDALAELGVAPADALVPGDEGVVVAVGGDRPPEVVADRFVEQRHVGRTAVDRGFGRPRQRCSRVQIAVTESRAAASTTNVFHVDTGESGVGLVVDDAVLRRPRLRGDRVPGVATMGELDVDDVGEPGERFGKVDRHETDRGDRRRHELDPDARQPADGGEVDVASEDHGRGAWAACSRRRCRAAG